MPNTYIPPKEKKSTLKIENKKNYSRLFWKTFIGFLLLIVIYFIGTSFGLFGYMPSFAELENPRSLLSAEIYSAEGKLMGKFYKQNRSLIEYENLPSHLVNALIATEDIRFREHSGIDIRALSRALYGVMIGDMKGGASTLSQQLAKNLFPREVNLNKIQLIHRKIKEWIIAIKLEKKYTKNEIITLYFNTVDYINTATGIKSAAQVYFNKSVDSLNIQEAAMIVGMCQNPVLYNPIKRIDKSKERRNIVLHQMVKYGYLTSAEFANLKEIPIELNFRPATPTEGIAPYFREYIRQVLKEWCATHKKPGTNENYDLYHDGLRIYTTIDSRMQAYAEEALSSHIRELQRTFNVGSTKPNMKTINDGIYRSDRYKFLKDSLKLSEDEITKNFNTKTTMRIFTWAGDITKNWTPKDSVAYYERLLHAGFMVMDPQSGYVKAWVGGINFEHFKYDHVNPNAKRQVGSTFKPFVYTMAIDNGYSPCFRVVDRRYCIGSWCPHNSDGGFSGASLTLKQALTKSKNSVSTYLMLQIKPEPVINLIKRMGIDVSNFKRDATICLGTQDISIFEMVAAYSTFANRGIYSKPVFISRIEDRNGNVIEEYRSDKVEIMSEYTAYIMTNMMESVVDFGTAKKLRHGYGFKVDLAGKTGTTQDNADGWFMGYTPRLVAGAWVGADNRQVHFTSTAIGQGASTALPIWAKFMKKVYSDKRLGYSQSEKFEKPEGDSPVELDCNKYYETEVYSGESIAKAKSRENSSEQATGAAESQPVQEEEYKDEFEK